MKKFMINLISVIFISIFIIGCSLKKPVFESAINADLSKVIHTINTQLVENEVPIKLSCTSFHIGGGYILTCNHGIELTERTIRTPFGVVTIPVFGTDYKYSMEGKEIELIGSIADVALLYNKELIGSPSVIFQDSNYLKVGDKLMLIGNTRMAGINIKLGIVSRISLTKSILNLPENTSYETFVMTNPSNPGDSGSPVFIIKENRYYLIGMAYATASNTDGYGYAIKSNYLSRVVYKLKSQEFNQY